MGKGVSSMFIAETHKICNQDKEVQALKKKRDEETHKSQLREIFSVMDKSGDGNVSWHELQIMLQNHKLLQWVEKMGINPLHLVELFKILKKGGGGLEDGYVALDEFVSAVTKVEGDARAIDILAVSKSVERLSSRLDAKESLQAMPFESVLQQGSPAQVSTLKLLGLSR